MIDIEQHRVKFSPVICGVEASLSGREGKEIAVDEPARVQVLPR
jgi:hypothetical protein